MEKKMEKALRQCANDVFASRLHDFSRFDQRSDYIWKGEVVFVCRRTEIWLFAIVSPDPKGRSSFTVEIGWSRHGRFPELGMRPSGFPNATKAEFAKAEFVCRLNNLGPGVPEFWHVQSYDSIREKVLNAVELTELYGIPYLTEAASVARRIDPQ